MKYSNFIGGLRAGYNFPIRENKAFLDITGCKDLLIADRNYYLAHKNDIEDWASGKDI